MRRQSIALEPHDKRPVGKWVLGKDWLPVDENKRLCLLVEKEFFHAVDKDGTYIKIYFDYGTISQSNKFIIVRKPRYIRAATIKVSPFNKRLHEDKEGFRNAING